MRDVVPSYILSVARADDAAVVLEDANLWSRYRLIAVTLLALALVFCVGPFVVIGGVRYIRYYDGLPLLLAFGAGGYCWLYYQQRYGKDAAPARLRFAGGTLTFTAVGRERRTRKVDLRSGDEWYVVVEGGQSSWKRRPGGATELAFEVYPPERAGEAVRAALATIGPGAVRASSLQSATLLVYYPNGLPHAPVAGAGADADTADGSPFGLTPPVPFGTEDETRGEYFTVARRHTRWQVNSRGVDQFPSNRLTVDLGEEWVRIANYPQLREIGRFEYLAYFRAEPTVLQDGRLPQRAGVLVKLYFRDHYPLEVFRVAGPYSKHPEFDGGPMLAEAVALCTWLNSLLSEARRRAAKAVS